MNAREQLVAWAKGELSDEAIKRAVLAADRAATDNIASDDERAVFVAELIERLGLKRGTGRPREIDATFDRDLIAFRHWSGRTAKHVDIVSAITKLSGMSATSVRNRLRVIDKRRAKIATLLESDVAEEGRKILAKAMAER